MRISTRTIGSYLVFDIQETLTLNSDITELRTLIDSALVEGTRSFALRFTPESYLSTRTIAVLVTCFENVKDHHGNLAIVEPNEDIIDVLAMIDMDKVVRFCHAEEELAAVPVHA